MEEATTLALPVARGFEGLPIPPSSSPCSSQTTTTTTTTTTTSTTSPTAAPGGTPPPRGGGEQQQSLSIAGTPTTILVPASPDSRGDQGLDPLGHYAFDLEGHHAGGGGGCTGGKRRRQAQQQLTSKLMDLRFDGAADREDDVFQQDTRKPHKKAKVAPEELPESASQCTICLESWQSSGPHKICSLKCGHLFGRSCIEKWLRNSKSCPICKAKSQRSHIRPLYVQHLLVVDNAEELRLSALLEEEAAKREKTVRNYRRDMEKLHLECMAYKQLVEKLKKELDDERTKRLHLQRMAMQTIQSSISLDTSSSAAFLSALAPSAPSSRPHSPSKPTKPACSAAPPSPVMLSYPPAALPSTPAPVPTPIATSTSTSPSAPASASASPSSWTSEASLSLSSAPKPSLLSLRSLSSSEILVDDPIAHLSVRLNDYRTPLPLATSHFKRKMDTVHKLSVRRSRVLDISSEGHLLASAVTGGVGASTKWGLVKVSLLDPSHQETIAGLHDKQIRDIKCGVLGSTSENLVLTASEDKALHVVSLRTNSSVQTFTLESGTWACEWDRNDPNYVYCGVRNAVWVYDMRNATIALPRPASTVTQPLHSLCFLPDYREGRKGLLAASCGGLFCYDLLNEWEATKIPFSGTCSSVSYDHASRHAVASFRSSPHYAKQSHNIFTFEGAKTKELRTLYSTSMQTLLSRSTLFSFVDGDDVALSRRLMLAAGSEASNAVALWDAASGQQITHQLASHSSPVMDVRHYCEGSGLFLASLSEQQILLHSLSSST